MGTPIVSLLTSAGGGGGSLPPKVINVPADFPTLIEANADIGRIYIAATNVTDNDPTKTNTGQSFLSGEEFVWDGISAYFKLGANALWLDDGTDYKTISPPRNLDLQNKDLKNVANAGIGNLSLTGNTITTTSGDLNLNSFSNDIHMQNARPATLQFPVGSQVSEILTAMPGSPNNSQLLSALAIKNAIGVEDTWNRNVATLVPSQTDNNVLIARSTSTSSDYSLKTDTTLTADVPVNGIVSEVTAFASGMHVGNELVAFKAILNHSASDTNGQYIAFKAVDFSTPFPSNESPSYGFWCGKEYDWGMVLESGRISLNDDYADIISCVRETVGDGASLTISAADGKSGGSPQDGGDFIIRAGLADGGTPGEIIFYIQTVPIAKFNSDGHLHLNDEESSSFTTSEFQIFKNSAPDLSFWSASAVASEDANLNLIRSRGTIGTPTAVQDNDLIGNINFIAASDGSTFNNGAEIRAEINGAVSTGVLPCDLVVYVNAGAGVATESARFVKDKSLEIQGDVKVDKLVGLTTSTTFSLDKLTFDTSVSAFTTISSADTTNVIILDGGASSAIFRLDRGATNQNGSLEFHTASVGKWTAGLIANEADDFLIKSSGIAGDIELLAGSSTGNVTLTAGSNGDVTLIPGINGEVKIENVRIDGSKIYTSAGALTLNSVANMVIIGDGLAGVDMVLFFNGQSNDGQIKWWEDEAYWTFDHPIVVATLNGDTSSGGILDLQSTTHATKGTIRIRDGSNFLFDDGGLFEVSPNKDAKIALGRAMISSPTSDVMYLSHYDNGDSNTNYGIKQLATGATTVNSATGLNVDIAINNVAQVSVDATKTTLTGYLNQTGIFAEIYVADASTAQLIPTGVTYTKSNAFTTDGLSSNCISAAASDKITITQIGKYNVRGSFSGISGTANVLWRGAAFLNGVEQPQCHFKRKMTTNTDAGSMSFNGDIDVTSVPWDLDFRWRHDNGGGVNFTIEYANLNVEYMGAT